MPVDPNSYANSLKQINEKISWTKQQISRTSKELKSYKKPPSYLVKQLDKLNRDLKALQADYAKVNAQYKQAKTDYQGPATPGADDDDADDAATKAADALNKKNASDYLIALFKTYGLENLAGEIVKLVQEGVTDPASVTLRLADTEEYKKRFAANEIRKQKGWKVYSPAEYLDLEESFRKVMVANGMPTGFYDQIQDFQEWIAGDVSPEEINDRVTIANDAVLKKDPHYLAALEKMGLNVGDMTAAVLDLKRAFPILKKLTLSAQIGAEAERAGVSWTKERADYLQGLGVNQDDARLGYGVVADNLIRAKSLGQRFNQQYGQEDLEQDWLVEKGQGPASSKRKRISSWEEALFSGTAGVNKKSFASKSRGEY